MVAVWVLVHPMQGEGDNSPITSFPYNSKEKLFVLMGQSEPPTQNAKGWMVGGHEILFHWVPVP